MGAGFVNMGVRLVYIGTRFVNMGVGFENIGTRFVNIDGLLGPGCPG
ncbi:MAG: hypothetical protein ABSF51_14195 [Verrucomicrobiota bacterium]